VSIYDYVYLSLRGRRVVGRLCVGGAPTRTAHIPGEQRRGPAGGDHQGAGHAHARTDPRDEPQLLRFPSSQIPQVPPDQGAPLDKGTLTPTTQNSSSPRSRRTPGQRYAHVLDQYPALKGIGKERRRIREPPTHYHPHTLHPHSSPPLPLPLSVL
jgi:hypothetical protein